MTGQGFQDAPPAEGPVSPQETQPSVAKPRYQLIDALRGLAIILMVGYHTGFLLIDYMGASPSLIDNPLLNLLQPIFGGLFILLSGMSCAFSRSNVRRGLKTWAAAILVSVAAGLFGYPVYFGILHFLGTAMLLYGLLQKPLRAWRGWTQPLVALALFVVTAVYIPIRVDFTNWLMPFGLVQDWGEDYWPLLPWFFLFLFGTWLGRLAVEQKFPRWFYRFKMPVLPTVGRYTLWIYLAHMPIVLGVIEVLKFFGVG